MTLEDVYFISQAIAAAAIVASLLFVGAQVKQASLRQKRETELNREELNNRVSMRLSEKEFGGLWFKASQQPERLTDEEIFRIYIAIRGLISGTRERFYEYKSGALRRELWEQSKGGLSILLTTPIFRATFLVCQKLAQPDPEFDAQFAEALSSPIRPFHADLIFQIRELATQPSVEDVSDVSKRRPKSALNE